MRATTFRGFSFTMGNRGDDRIHNVFGFVRIRSLRFDPFVKATAGIDIRRTQICAAQIDGADEFGC